MKEDICTCIHNMCDICTLELFKPTAKKTKQQSPRHTFSDKVLDDFADLSSVMNNFYDYGFVGDFKGEILKEVDGIYIGYIIDNVPVPVSIDKDGDIFNSDGTPHNLCLAIVKKKWYEDESNFPCWIIDNNGDINTIEKAYSLKGADYYSKNCDTSYHGGYYRLATKEEVMSLYCEED